MVQNLSIIGLGKLGSPMAAVFASKGFNVIGIDKNLYFVDKINNKEAPVLEEGLQELIDKGANNLEATNNMASILKTEATFIIVPTPSDESGAFSNQYVIEAIKEIGHNLRDKIGYHLVVVTSTVMPGSMEGEIKYHLESSSGKKIGQEIGFCYNPEFIALGTVIRDMLNPDFCLIGESDKKAGDILENIYDRIYENKIKICRMNLINAELTKIAINTYLTFKISYGNMLSEICDYLPETDVDIITKTIGKDSRIGEKYLRSGVAYGGPCLPRDTVAFALLSRQVGVKNEIAEAVHKINLHQSQRIINIIEKLNLANKKIAILGLSYKNNTPVIEESQGIALAKEMLKKSYQVSVYDPMAMENARKVLPAEVEFANSAKTCIENSDITVIMTAWPEFGKLTDQDFGLDKFIIDPWRILNDIENNNIIHLGAGFFKAREKLGVNNDATRELSYESN